MDLLRPLSVFSLLILSLLVCGAFAARNPFQGSALLGGYTAIENPNDPYVVGIAKFAVSQHNKDASDDLVFVKVLSGQKQVVSGTNYKLVISAKHGVADANANANAGTDQYEAVVYDKSWAKYRSLTSFNKV